MKAYALVRPHDLVAFAGFLSRTPVFIGEEIIPYMCRTDLSKANLSREDSEKTECSKIGLLVPQTAALGPHRISCSRPIG